MTSLLPVQMNHAKAANDIVPIGATVTIRWIDAQTDGPQRRVPSRTEQTHRIPRGDTTCAQLAGRGG
jgi:hypothetical protein